MKSLLSFALASQSFKSLVIACLPFLLCSAALHSFAVDSPAEIGNLTFERTFVVERSDPILSLQELNEDIELQAVSQDVSEYIFTNPNAFDIDELTAELSLKYGSVQPYLGDSEPEYYYYVDENGVLRRSCFVSMSITLDSPLLSQDVIVYVHEITQS